MKSLQRISLVVFLALATLGVVAGCNSGVLSPLTQENLDKIQTGMSTAQVKAILGEPTSSDTEPIPIVGGTKTTLDYSNANAHVEIVLKNDTVQTKQGNFGTGQ
jgi:hypothetical protein